MSSLTPPPFHKHCQQEQLSELISVELPEKAVMPLPEKFGELISVPEKAPSPFPPQKKRQNMP